MRMNQWGLVVALVLGPGCTLPARAGETPTHTVEAGRLSVHVDVWGFVQPTRSNDVYCQVEGQTTILSFLPEGTKVTRGQIVCELDSAQLMDQLRNQVSYTTKGAEASYQNAKLTREVAEIAVTEYKVGLLPQQRQSLAGELEVAQKTDLPVAEDRVGFFESALKEAEKLLAANGGVRSAADLAARIDLQERLRSAQGDLARAKAAIPLIRSRQDVLEKYTAPQRIRELTASVEKARSEELARQSAFEREKSREAKLRSQIAFCKLPAPRDGVVLYSVPFVAARAQIAEGASVRERQKVFSIADPHAPMRVMVSVPAAVVGWLRPGQHARVLGEGLEGGPLSGSVEEVTFMPGQLRAVGQERTYTVYVRVDGSPPGLSINMTAEVEIDPEPLQGVVSVPTQAVVYYGGLDHVAIKKPGGGWDWRVVTLGLSDGKSAEVKSGLRSGDAVALDPAPLLSGGQKLRIAITPPRPEPGPRTSTPPSVRPAGGGPPSGS
jgi:HlyD family secretion protein